MPRILGVEIPDGKHAWVSLTYIKGIGPATAKKILADVGIDAAKKAGDLSDDELARLGAKMDKDFQIEGQLTRQTIASIDRLKKIKCYRGVRHIRGLPVRGQRTRTNARTRKGPKRTVAKKKSIKGLRT